jgi:hypothetical protein
LLATQHMRERVGVEMNPPLEFRGGISSFPKGFLQWMKY